MRKFNFTFKRVKVLYQIFFFALVTSFQVQQATAACTAADEPSSISVSTNTVCPGNATTLSWTGNLNDATAWHIYTTNCGVTELTTTTSNSIEVSPTSTTTYYIRGEGENGCDDSELFDTEFSSLLPGENEIFVEFDNLTRRMIIVTPATYDNTRLYPALFGLHGAGGKGDGFAVRFGPEVDERDMILISLEAVQPLAKWNFYDDFQVLDQKDVELIEQITKSLIAENAIEPDSVYATGHSSGGLLCWRLAKESNLFAALAPQSCGMTQDAHEPDASKKQVPVMQVIGTEDKSYNGSNNAVVMYSAVERIDIWTTFNECDPTPVVTNPDPDLEVSTYTNDCGIEVVICRADGEEHNFANAIRETADDLVLDFLFRHAKRVADPIDPSNSIEVAVVDVSTIEGAAACDFTDIAKNEAENQINIFPNPTSGTFTVSGSLIDQIEILDLLGNKVLVTKDLVIDLSNYANGIYFVNIESQNGQGATLISTKKVLLVD